MTAQNAFFVRVFLQSNLLVAAFLGLDLTGAAGPAEAATGVEQSVVKLSVTIRRPDYERPWSKASSQKIFGSGVVIGKNLILTNAHMVAFSSEVFVQLHRGGNPLLAKVKSVAPGMDLALIELEDPAALDGVPAVPLASELPELRSSVTVYGFPEGGEDLSVTKGIVSRLEFVEFNYDACGVRVQVDAALNPGNSGGPAIQGNQIVGLAFDGVKQADNIGYLIPATEIRDFLHDLEDGSYAGNPALYDNVQSAENDALRQSLKIPAGVTGVVINTPYRNRPDYPLKKWDVITHVGPHAIDNQGQVGVRAGLRLDWRYWVPKLQHNGEIELTIWRDGRSQVLDVPVVHTPELLIPYLKDQYPEYFIFGPLVFTVATQEHLALLNAEWTDHLNSMESPLLRRNLELISAIDDQLVIMASEMLPHRLTKGYTSSPFTVVKSVNGIKLKNLRHLAELLHDCRDDFVRFELADRIDSLVFRRADLAAATDEILTNEGIRYQASPALRDIWKTPSP